MKRLADPLFALVTVLWTLAGFGLAIGGAFVLQHMVLHRVSLTAAIGVLMIWVGGLLTGMIIVLTVEYARR